MKPTLLLAVSLSLALLGLPACGGGGPEEVLADAQSALDAKDFAKAEKLAARAADLAQQAGDDNVAWRATRVGIDARALSGVKGDETREALEQAAEQYADSVDAPFYAVVAGKVDKAGDTLSAIKIVDAGIKRYPAEKDAFTDLLNRFRDKASAAEGSPEYELLKQLGYL